MSRRSSRVPLVVTLYQEYLDSQDSAALASRAAAAYTQGTLERLAEHPAREVRRAAVCALGLLGDYEANAVLGRALQDDDRTVRLLAESGIRNVWQRAGSEQQRRQLALVVRLNVAKQHEEAARRATELAEQAPWFAEVWNQRAAAHFGLARYAEAIRDCHQALELNPYHFDAAVGMGYAYLKLDNRVAALECFRRALRLNPNLEDVRAQIARLARMIEGK